MVMRGKWQFTTKQSSYGIPTEEGRRIGSQPWSLRNIFFCFFLPRVFYQFLFIYSFFLNVAIRLSFTLSIPPFFPVSPLLWVTDTRGKMCVVCLPLCTGRMLLPSGAIPSASKYVVRSGPKDGKKEKKKKKHLTSIYCSTHTSV